MSNFTDFFPAAGGGGGTPKFQEFTISGTFTPTQALIDAGGYIDIFIVGGGGQKTGVGGRIGAAGGETTIKRMYLTSTNSITITIGAGGNANNVSGGNSQFLGSSAGGQDITAKGGRADGAQEDAYGAGYTGSTTYGASGNGLFGYGQPSSGGLGGVYTAKANSGQAGYYYNAADGYCLIKWQE